jgi:seryl-tRNA synthetase
MITRPYIRENKDEAIERLAIRNIDARATIENILATDADKRKKQAELETGLAEANALAKKLETCLNRAKPIRLTS